MAKVTLLLSLCILGYLAFPVLLAFESPEGRHAYDTNKEVGHYHGKSPGNVTKIGKSRLAVRDEYKDFKLVCPIPPFSTTVY